MKKLEVKVDFKIDLRDLVEGFLFCTDNMNKIDDYILDYEVPLCPECKIIVMDNIGKFLHCQECNTYININSEGYELTKKRILSDTGFSTRDL